MADSVGKLVSFGVEHEKGYQALMIAPNRYDDLRECLTSLRHVSLPPEGAKRLVSGIISRAPRYDAAKKRTTFQIRLSNSADFVEVMAFAHPRQLPDEWQFVNAPVYMLGKLVARENQRGLSHWLFDPKPVPAGAIGKALAIYPQKKGVIGSEKLRQKIHEQINPESFKRLLSDLDKSLLPYSSRQLLQAWGQARQTGGMERVTLAKVIYRLHSPSSPEQGARAKQLLDDLGAVAALLSAERERPKASRSDALEFDSSALAMRVNAMTHTPTAEQLQAMHDSLSDMASGKPMHRLLSGDTGTGKTTVFALVAAAVADAGGSVGIMLPNAGMVGQVHSEMKEWWPDLSIEEVTNEKRDNHGEARIKLGTTALLHRYSDWQPTLTIVDEQQKYSIDQRQQLSEGGGHLLEATATCMPRTLAQVQYGLIPVSRLTQPHTPKQITTTLFDASLKEHRQNLFKALQATLSEQEGQTLVVFAARDAKEANKLERDEPPHSSESKTVAPKVVSLEEGFATWSKAAAEGVVVALHGKMSAKEKRDNLDAIKSGKARVMCATIAAEVGLNIPDLRQVIIYNAERFGLTQLHQLRGRVARLGGAGRCDVFVDKPSLTPMAIERLDALCSTSDGFELSELDLQQRGLGDLVKQGNRQSGISASHLLLNTKLTAGHFATAQQILDLAGPPEGEPHMKAYGTPSERIASARMTNSPSP